MRPPHWAMRLAAARDWARVRRGLADPAATQSAVLRRILRLYRDTELGRTLDLATIDGPAAFARRVPVTDEAFYAPFHERVRETNAAGVATPRALRYMARTSGTTRVSKYLPYPEELIRAFKTFETRVTLHAMRDLGRYDLLDGQLLITSSAPSYERTAEGLTIGSSSGIMTLLAPAFARTLVRPTPDVLALTDWQAKIEATARQALPLDIRVMTGIPLFVVPILERLLALAAEAGRPAANARELWPNLTVYYWSGASIALYEARLRALFGPGVHFREIYSATEAPIAYQHRDGEPGLLVNLEHAYFEFQEAEAPADAPRLGVADVRVGVPYRVLVTTLGGLFAYRLGDVVEFVSTAPLCLRVLGREVEELNLASEKMPRRVLEAALADAAQACAVSVRDYFIAPPADTRAVPAYHWYLELSEPADLTGLGRALDEALRSRHNYYRAIRADNAVLGPCVAHALPPGTLDAYVLDTRPFGQGKPVKLYGDRTLPDRILAYAATRADVAADG
ncbi:MAG TPA: GH3 auxin-responsive promoter family protein [Oscillatoriaceae cyanobacterium]